MALPIPPAPVVLGFVAPLSQIGVAGESLTMYNPVAVPGAVAGVLRRGAVLILGDDAGLAAVMVQGPMPNPAAGDNRGPDVPWPRVPQRPVPFAAAMKGVLTAVVKAFITLCLIFLSVLLAMHAFGFYAQYTGLYAYLVPPPMCYPSEAPPPPPTPPMQGDGGGNNYDHHRGRAADGDWNSGEGDWRDRINCFKLIVNQASRTCFGRAADGDMKGGEHRGRDASRDSIKCFKMLVREATGICFGDDD